MPDAFYLPDGDRFVSTALTRGPWDPGAQHGGPPAALLATALERRHPRDDVQVVRVSVEILRPVPIAPLTATTQMLRPGRSVEMLAGSLAADGTEVLRATVVRIRTTSDLPLVETAAPADRPPGPEQAAPVPFFPTGQEFGYHTATEWRFVRGAFTEVGPATAWMRMRSPLVAGEETSPLARVLVAADAASGIASALDYRRWLFINADLTVSVYRLPAGDWVGLDARTTVTRRGLGLAESVIFDQEGPAGRSLQSLFIAERR